MCECIYESRLYIWGYFFLQFDFSPTFARLMLTFAVRLDDETLSKPTTLLLLQIQNDLSEVSKDVVLETLIGYHHVDQLVGSILAVCNGTGGETLEEVVHTLRFFSRFVPKRNLQFTFLNFILLYFSQNIDTRN
jgi:hypothetical protein